MSDVEILNGDFECIKDKLTSDSFVYIDSPYQKISETANFTAYTKLGFSEKDQIRLRDFCDYIDSIGAKFMASNSSAALIYSLYEDYIIEEVQARRSVNCKGDGRGKVTELIIRNYTD